MLVLLILDKSDADGALPAAVARIGLGVEGDLLALSHLLEAAIENGRVMEEEVLAAALGGDEAEAAIADALDDTGAHKCSAFCPASLDGVWPGLFPGAQVARRQVAL